MAGIFTKRIWQPYIYQPNELKREIKKKTGGGKRGAKQKYGGPLPTQPPTPLRIATDQDWIRLMIFKNFTDQDWIGFNFIGSRLDSDSKIC